MGKRLFSLPLRALMLAALVAAALPAGASIRPAIRTTEDHSDRVESAERCISHIKAYRGAIGYLDDRLEKSPAKLTYVSKSGEQLVVFNRRRARMEQDRVLLSASLRARTRACRDALSG